MSLLSTSLLQPLCLIDGRWQAALDAAVFDVDDPATGQVIAQVANGGVPEVRAAIAAAEHALPAWRAKPARERAQVLRRWYELILEHADELARILTTEQGKPLAEAKGEVLYGASFVEWFAEQGRRIMGDIMESPQADKRLLVLRQGIGVCAAITPWNFPNAMVTRKAAPALAAGCTLVLKPAEQTPLSALVLGELALRAGVPPGVFNIVPCSAESVAQVGAELCASPVVRKLSFTGSTEIGRLLMRQCADTVKKLSLELGGNAPFIVFEDADLEAAVEGAVLAKFRNAGQTCVCANRIYVHAAIYEAFAQRLTARVQQLRVGPGVESGKQIGPLIDEAAVAKVEAHIQDAMALGSQVLTGGKKIEIHGYGTRFFMPTVLTGMTASMRIAHEEIFGPVAPLFSFQSEQEVVAAANATEYGLAAYVFTRDLTRVWRVTEALEYGMVGVNTGIIGNEVIPFGGVKQSGLGREGSVYGIDEYLEMKALCLGGM
ncbi:MAG: NAD-dependent succinate-semialdehyde dehydrogenase [Burkholderiales bacterium]